MRLSRMTGDRLREILGRGVIAAAKTEHGHRFETVFFAEIAEGGVSGDQFAVGARNAGEFFFCPGFPRRKPFFSGLRRRFVGVLVGGISQGQFIRDDLAPRGTSRRRCATSGDRCWTWRAPDSRRKSRCQPPSARKAPVCRPRRFSLTTHAVAQFSQVGFQVFARGHQQSRPRMAAMSLDEGSKW
jgi:hypothetical protein